MTFKTCKRIIENGTYGTKEEMLEKLEVFYLGNRLNKEQYLELTQMLENI